MTKPLPKYAGALNGNVYAVTTINDAGQIAGNHLFTCESECSAMAAAVLLNRMHEALKEAEQMRRFQRAFFKGRGKRELAAAQLHERRFDQLLKLALNYN